MHRFGAFGLLIIITSFLAILTAPTLGMTVGDAGVSAQQGLNAVMITVRDCAGNPVPGAAIQLVSLTWEQWAYTDSNGAAFLSVPAGAYTLQGGYYPFTISQPIIIGTGSYTLAVNLGSGCAGYTTASTSTSSIHTVQCAFGRRNQNGLLRRCTSTLVP